MVAVPLKFVAGVNTTFVPEMSAVPLVGLTEVMINVSPSGSLSLTSGWIVTLTSSNVLVASFRAMGASFTGVTVTVISALAGSPSGSLSLTNTGIVTGVSSDVVARSLTATGGSFTGVTVTVTMALALRLP